MKYVTELSTNNLGKYNVVPAFTRAEMLALENHFGLISYTQVPYTISFHQYVSEMSEDEKAAEYLYIIEYGYDGLYFYAYDKYACNDIIDYFRDTHGALHCDTDNN